MRIVYFIALQMLREARHNKLGWLFALVLVSGLGLCEYISSVALIEAEQFQLAIYSNVMRWAAAIVLLQFVVSSLGREFNEKGADYLLAMPMSRWQYLLGKALGIVLLSLLMAALIALVLLLYQPGAASLIWVGSLAMELLVLGCFALFVSISLQNPALAAAVVIAFYVLCRALSSIELLASQPLVSHSGVAQQFMAGLTEWLSYLLPALYQFAQTEWLLYPSLAANLTALAHNAAQCLVYCTLLLGAAGFDLYRKSL
ncbi:MAG: hypothetical protein CSA54_03545 [Gammaproteobacteria bacterium]|nr:MAG: hypothetical protein CSA54_03545 [Gammaproteobacteria bacterium]